MDMHAHKDAISETLPGTLIYRENRRMRKLRRFVDVFLGLLAGVAVVPIVALACVAILLEDGRPVFFQQRRVGRFERLFTIYKLRTMRLASSDDRPSPTQGDDPRVTVVGRLLRKTSIDELPQLLNVIRGDMSLVGPRPEMPFHVEGYQSWQHLRHLVTPGITCIWQATCRSRIPLHKPAATMLDLDYIRRASPVLDGTLILQTAISVILRKGAY